MRPITQTPSGTQSNAATVKDVAAQAGVSIATVSRVLSGKGGVRRELAERVRKAVQELDYHPNLSARRLRKRESKIIGVLVPDIQIPFFASIVVGIDKILQEAGYLLLLGNTNDTLAGEQTHISIFLGEDVSGIIFAATNAQDTSNYQRLLDLGIPLVAIDRSPGSLDVDTIQVDNAPAASQATLHLIQEGHQRIALISGPSTISTAIERQLGYEQALRTAGLSLDPRWIQPGHYTHEGGYRAMQAIMESADRPTAVVITNQVMALGALQFVHERGYEIPCDIAIISFDDMAWASALRPPLTVISQPEMEMGTLAAQLIVARIREPSSSIKHITLKTKLILRASCNCGGSSQRLPLP